jgi:hypothetical protein
MSSGLRATVLAAYNSRSRIIRQRDGAIQLFWEVLSIKMTQAEFLGFVDLVTEAAGRMARCGELARGSCGRADRCPMGQIMLSHGSFTLWFSPEEFEEFHRLLTGARRKLADSAPAPPLGLPWVPSRGGFSPN